MLVAACAIYLVELDGGFLAVSGGFVGAVFDVGMASHAFHLGVHTLSSFSAVNPFYQQKNAGV